MPAPVPFDPEDVAAAKGKPRAAKPGIVTRKTICQTCDIACSVVSEVKNGRVVKVRSSDNPLFRDHICMKGIVAPKGYANPNRITRPLKRVGARHPGNAKSVALVDGGFVLACDDGHSVTYRPPSHPTS